MLTKQQRSDVEAKSLALAKSLTNGTLRTHAAHLEVQRREAAEGSEEREELEIMTAAFTYVMIERGLYAC